MKHILIGIALAVSALGQTQITDTLPSPIQGRLFEGTLVFTASTLMTCSGQAYMRDAYKVSVRNGLLDIALMPNDLCLPAGTRYKVVAQPKTGVDWPPEYWVVRQSETPLKVNDVRTIDSSEPLPSSAIIQPSQIGPAGGTDGQCMKLLNSSWGPYDCGSGSGGDLGSLTGVIVATAGVASVVTGTGTDCVLVNGSSGPCGTGGGGGGTGDVTSAVSSATNGQLAVASGTSGKNITFSTLTGVVVSTGGVASVVTGTASNCVLVDGTSGPCGTGGGGDGVVLPVSGFESNGTMLVPDGTVVAELHGNNTWTGINDFSAGTMRVPVLSSAPTLNCTSSSDVGRLTVLTLGSTLYICLQTSSSVFAWVTK